MATVDVPHPRSRADLLASIAVCELVGIVPGYLTREDITEWYLKLNKPEWTPPNWVFGPVWTTLYLLQGIALHRARREAGTGGTIGLFASSSG